MKPVMGSRVMVNGGSANKAGFSKKRRSVSISMIERLRRWTLRIPESEACFDRWGLHGGFCSWRRLEQASLSIIRGYNRVLEENLTGWLFRDLRTVASDDLGFAEQGVAMGAAMLDLLIPEAEPRLSRFREIMGDGFSDSISLGLGCCYARASLPIHAIPVGLSAADRWLVIEGHGFYSGYLGRCSRSDSHSGRCGAELQDGRAFDQGLGRSLWFSRGADPEWIGAAISTTARPRRGDVWTGVGWAAADVGGGGPYALAGLCQAAGAYLPALARGAALAARSRRDGRILVRQTDLACELLCGMTSEDAAELVDRERHRPPTRGSLPADQDWRRRVLVRFA
jgi:hypothetical protein